MVFGKCTSFDCGRNCSFSGASLETTQAQNPQKNPLPSQEIDQERYFGKGAKAKQVRLRVTCPVYLGLDDGDRAIPQR